MKHKTLNRFISAFLCGAMILSFLCFGLFAFAEESGDGFYYSSDLNEFSTEVTIYDDDLHEISVNDEIYFGRTYELIISFNEDAGNADNPAGKQFCYIDDPDDPNCGWMVYELPGSLSTQPSSGDVMVTRNDGTKVPIGEYEIDGNGIARVKFGSFDKYGNALTDGANFIDEYQDATFTLKFSCSVLDNGNPDEKILDLGDDLHITVQVVNEGDLNMTKTASKYDYENNQLTYYVHVSATNGTVEDAYLTDTATNGQLINAGSFEIYDKDGNDVTSLYTPVISAQNPSSFTLDLGDMCSEDFFDIVYKTDIPAASRHDSVWFDNSAVAHGTDLRGNPTEATAHYGQNVIFLQVLKNGSQTVVPYTENGTTTNHMAVRWALSAEQGTGTLDTASFTDLADAHQTIYTQDSGLRVDWVDTESRGNAIIIPWSEVNLTNNGRGFTLNVPIIDAARGWDTSTADKYQLTYFTIPDILDGSVSNSVVFQNDDYRTERTSNIGLISGTADVVKTVQLSDDGNYLDYVVKATVPAGRQNLNSFSLSDSAFFASAPTWQRSYAQGALYENLSLEVDVMDAENTHIVFTELDPNSGVTENTFYRRYYNAGETNFFFNGETQGAWNSHWHIADASVITLKYSIPLDSYLLNSTYALTDKTIRESLAEGLRFENDATLNYGGASKFTRVYYSNPVQKTCDKQVDSNTGEALFNYQVELIPVADNDKQGACLFDTAVSGNDTVAVVDTIAFIDDFDDRFEYVPGSLQCSLRYNYTGGFATFNYTGNATFSNGRIYANFADFVPVSYDQRYVRPAANLKLTMDQVNVIRMIYDFTYTLRLKDPDSPDENILHLDNTAWFEWDETHSTPPVDCEVQHRTNLINKGYVQDGDEVDFTIEINPTAKDLLPGADTITLRDTMSENLSVFWDSLTVSYLDDHGVWTNISLVDADASYDPETNSVQVTVPDSAHVKIEYTTLITETGSAVEIGNTVTVVGYGSFNDVVGSTFVVAKSDASASAGSGHFTLVKNGSDGARLSGAVFALYSQDAVDGAVAPSGTDASITADVNGTAVTMYYAGTYTTGNDGTAFIENVALEDNEYYALVEVGAPAGYLPLPEPYVFNFNPNALSHHTGTVPQIHNLRAFTDMAIVPDKIVIDYGLPVEIHVLGNDFLCSHITGIGTEVSSGTVLFNTAYDASRLDGDFTSLKGVSNKIQLPHGSAYLTADGTIIYTPTDMEMSTEDVIFYEYTAENGEIFYSTVTVIPAANMYFEFPAATEYYPQEYIHFTDGDGYVWTDVGTTYNRLQAEDRPGTVTDPEFDANNVYGFDQAYIDNSASTTYSLGSARKAVVDAGSNGREPTLEFTFCGTGFDLFSVTDNTSGALLCEVYTVSGTRVKKFNVNNYYGYSYAPACFDEQTGEMAKSGIPMYKMPEGILPPVSEVNALKAALPFLDEDCGREVWKIPTYWTDSSETALTVEETAYPAYAVDTNGDRRYSAGGSTTTVEATDEPLYFAPFVRYHDCILMWSIPTYLEADGVTVTYTQTNDPMIASGWFADGTGCLYQVPCIRCRDLDYGTYRVVVTPKYGAFWNKTGSSSYSVCVDAVRTYNPAGVTPSVQSVIGSAYIDDDEYVPEYKEIRVNMLDADSFYAGTAPTDANGLYAGFAFIDGISSLDGNIPCSISNQYLHSGPNNELYLARNQAVACYVRSDAVISPAALQLGMKTILGGTGTLMVYNSRTQSFEEISVAGGSAQYRDLLGYLTWDTSLQKQGVYQTADPLLLINTSDTVISFTGFKIAYDRSKPARMQTRTEFVTPKEMVRNISALLTQLPSDSMEEQPGEDLAFTAASVTLKSDLSLNFFIPEETADSYTGTYVLFGKEIYDNAGNPVRTVKYPVYDYSVQEVNGVLCRCYTFNGIAPQELGSIVTAKMFVSAGGAPCHGPELTYSIQTYAENMLDKTDDETFRTLLIDMLNYGAAAQEYAGYRTSAPANGNLSSADKARADEYLSIPVSCTQLSPEPDASVSITSASLILKDRIALCISAAFTGETADLSELEAEFVYRNVNGQTESAAVPGSMFTPNGGGFTVVFDGMNAALLRTPVTVRIRNANDGRSVSGALTYSAESYAAAMENTSDPLLRNLLCAMLNYGDSAGAFLTGRRDAE